MKWVDATKLVQWADTKSCESLLPELLRKLIIANSKKKPGLSFPSGDSIYKPGWDGTCIYNETNNYIPEGSSYWELGRGKDYKKKCTSDYNKRTRQTKAAIRRKSTFVFVTPRRWDKAPLKNSWIETTIKKKQWKKVIVYDADDIESWLEQTPAVGIWLAKELRIATDNVETASDYWNRFVGKLKFTPALIVSGREDSKNEILRFFEGQFGVKEIQASSVSEAICLTIASVISQGVENEQDFFSRTIVASSRDSLKTLTSTHENINIIYSSTSDEVIENIEARQTHIINPVSFGISSKAGIRIPLPKSEIFIKSLVDVGYSHERAIKLSKESGRSFSVIKRILSESPGRVSWREGNNILELLPIFLTQKIDENKPGDRWVIEQFSKEEFISHKDKLKKWSLIFDHPVTQTGNHWRAVSPYDLLHVIGSQISEHHLTQFEDVLTKVLNEIDPSLDLEPKMRYASAIFNKESPYSRRIKEGLCQTLVLLVVYGESSGINVNFNIQQWADRLIEKLLSNRDTKFWLSIESKLHLIAEISPTSFLNSLEKMIKEDPEVIGGMFSNEGTDLFTHSYHIHILWALESLAWDPNSLLRVTLILANLVKLDRGIKTENKPINSLRYIFLFWLPQTFAPLTIRNKVIESLIRRDQEIAFLLLKKISPKSNDTGWYSYKPIFRMQEYVSEKVTVGEYREAASFIREKLCELASNRYDRWSQIIESIDDFHGEDRAKMIESLINIDVQGDVTILRDKLQAFIRRHETYSKQDWALKTEELKPLKVFFESLIKNEIDKYYWYFNVETVEQYGKSKDNYETQIKKSDIKRNEAIELIYKSHGKEGLIELAVKVERPWVVGIHIGETLTDLDDFILPLVETEGNVSQMAFGFISSISRKRGFDWIQRQANSYSKHLDTNTLATFFMACEPSSKIWELLKNTSSDANVIYWQKVNFHFGFFRHDNSEFVRYIENLNSYKRYASSINLCILSKEDIPAQIIYDTLEGLTLFPVEDRKIEYGPWGIQELFIQLDKENDISESKMVNLEWHYLTILLDSPRNRSPKYLFKALEDPKFFSEVVLWIYPPENTKKEISDPDVRRFTAMRARNADSLLDAWTKVPGENESHEIDFQIFNEWAHKVVDESEKLDRKNNAYYTIGKLIGISRERSSKWPQNEFCQIIEDLNNDKLNEGFIIGAINGSEVTVRLRPAGSNDEKTLFEYYKKRSEDFTNEFPIVAKLLLDVAKHYESWAQYMDLRNAQRDIDN